MQTKNLVTKKSILLVSLGYTVYFIFYLFLLKTCHHDTPFCHSVGGAAPTIIFLMIIGLPFLPVFPLSLLTYRMDERIFTAWRAFALYAVPIASIILLGLSQKHINTFAAGAVFALIIFSGVLFIVISLAIIVSKWLSLRKQSSLRMKR